MVGGRRAADAGAGAAGHEHGLTRGRRRAPVHPAGDRLPGSYDAGALEGFLRKVLTGEERPHALAAAVRVGAVEGWDGEEGRAVEEEPLDAIMGGDDGDDEL